MQRNLILTVALLSLTAFGQARRAPALEVTAVRCWSFSEITRVAIETNGEFEYRFERLQNPDRIFFDLLGARPGLGGRKVHVTEVDDKILKRIRVAETLPGITRIVLDLETPSEVVASQLGNPDRLIVELRPAAKVVEPPSLAPSVVSPRERPKSAEVAANIKPDLPSAVLDRTLETQRPLVDPGPPIVRASRAKPAKRNSKGESSLIRALGLKVARVVIDPGHGGHDYGTIGAGGLTEKDLVLDVATRLGKLVEQRMGSEVIYTRTSDTFIPLESRTALANQKKADLFFSLHANSSPSPEAGGVETYYLNFTNSSDALAVASRENASSQKSIYELRDIIQTITLHDKAEESKEFASQVQSALHGFASKSDPSVKNRGVKKAPFVVLIGASMPSVLAEIGFVSNPKEEVRLKRPEYRQRLAEALYRGLSRYAQTLSHFQVAQAAERP